MVSYSQCGLLGKQWAVSTQPMLLNLGTSVLSITWGHHKGLHIHTVITQQDQCTQWLAHGQWKLQKIKNYLMVQQYNKYNANL